MSEKGPNKNLLSVECDDDQKDIEGFTKFMSDHTTRQKKNEADTIIELGESLLEELEHKHSIQDVTKAVHMDYILKKTNKYSQKYLLELDYKDVKDIYEEVKFEYRSWLKKLMEFFS